MITRPSIQFDAMSRTAGEVNARSTRFGTILRKVRHSQNIAPTDKRRTHIHQAHMWLR